MSTITKAISLALFTSIEKNSVKSFLLSKIYIKRFLKIGTLNIIYRRVDIPEIEFELKTYENVSYVVFKRQSTNKFIRNYHVFTLGFLDAVEKDYLKEIFMYIRDKNGKILEMYNFKVKYNKNAEKSDTKHSQVKSATTDFLQALADLPGKKLAPDQVQLFMEFTYNDNTPLDYEPPNFEPTKEPLFVSLKSNKILKLGSVNTGFHKVSAWGRGTNFSESRATTPDPQSFLEEVDLTENEKNSENGSTRSDKQNKKHKYEKINEEPNNDRKKTKLDQDNIKSVTLVDLTDDTNSDNISVLIGEDVRCICKWNLTEQFETTRCTECNDLVHLACHGYLKLSDNNKSTFVCGHCSNVDVNENSMQMLVKLRIILYGIYVKEELPVELNYAEPKERDYLLCQLDNLGVYNSEAKDIHAINLNKLNEAVLAVFSTENSQYLE